MNSSVDKIKIHILCAIAFSENRAVYDIMSKNVMKLEKPQVTIWRMRVACWIRKVTRAQAQARAREPTPTRTYSPTHADTQKYVIVLLFHANNNFVNAPHCYVARALRVLLFNCRTFRRRQHTWFVHDEASGYCLRTDSTSARLSVERGLVVEDLSTDPHGFLTSFSRKFGCGDF